MAPKVSAPRWVSSVTDSGPPKHLQTFYGSFLYWPREKKKPFPTFFSLLSHQCDAMYLIYLFGIFSKCHQLTIYSELFEPNCYSMEFFGSHPSIALPSRSRFLILDTSLKAVDSTTTSFHSSRVDTFWPEMEFFNSFFSLFSSSRQIFVTRFPLSLELNLYANTRQTPASWRHQLTCQLVWI